MNSSLAALYVEQHGDPAQRARLRYIYSGQAPADDSIRLALAGQRADGGWQSTWAPDYSAIDATCYRLGQIEHHLEIRYEKRRRRQAVHDAQSCRLGEREEELGGRKWCHIRPYIYTVRRISASASRLPHSGCKLLTTGIIAKL